MNYRHPGRRRAWKVESEPAFTTSLLVDPLDLVAWGLSELGPPLCGDATIVHPLHATGMPHTRAATVDGASLASAAADKERTYPELVGTNPYDELLVLAPTPTHKLLKSQSHRLLGWG